MLKNIEELASAADLRLTSESADGVDAVDHPHIEGFRYRIERCGGAGVLERVGYVDGYRIVCDGRVEDDLALWDEADALSADAVCYVEALVRELRACERVFGGAPALSVAERVTIVRHVEVEAGPGAPKLMQGAVACLVVIEAPGLVLVDPWPMPEERELAAGKMRGRGHAACLLELGLCRMVGSRFLWGWSREMGDSFMGDFDYDQLLACKRRGDLDEVLGSPLAAEIYGDLPDHLSASMGLPKPDELTKE